jgi:hypothetical protein
MNFYLGAARAFLRLLSECLEAGLADPRRRLAESVVDVARSLPSYRFRRSVAVPQIMPAFQRHPAEAAIIGRILAGYGELEFLLSMLLGSVVGDLSTANRVLFRGRGEEARLLIADALVRPAMEKCSFQETWTRIFRAMFHCKRIRNQYAHCHWLDDGNNGLFFTQIEKAAKTRSGSITLKFLHVDTPLLESQEAYFHFVDFGLCYLREVVLMQNGKIRNHTFPPPGEKQAPPLHNPEAEHPLESKVTV